MKQLLFFVAAIILLSGCSSFDKGDPEVEKLFDGTWTCSVRLTDYDGGERTVTEMAFCTQYNAEDNTFNTIVFAGLVYPAKVKMFTCTYSGKWKAADSRSLTEYPDEDSFSFTFHTNLLSEADKREMREGIMTDLSGEVGYDIRKMDVSGDKMHSFVLFDGEDKFDFKRAS